MLSPQHIPVGTITQHRHDGRALAQPFGDFRRGHDIQRARRAHVQALLIQQPVHHLDRLCIRDMNRAVQQVQIGRQVGRQSALSDTLGDGAAAFTLGLARLNELVEHTSGRVGEVALDAAVRDFLQVPDGARERSARTGGARECVHLAARLAPDLGTGGLDVSFSIGCVVELVGPHGVFEGLGVTLGLVVVVLGVVKGDGWWQGLVGAGGVMLA